MDVTLDLVLIAGSVANFGVETIWDVLTWSVGVTRR